MYCYNYKFLEVLYDCALRNDYMNNRGYFPLCGYIRNEVIMKTGNQSSFVILDHTKIHYLEQLVKETTEFGKKVIFVISPYRKNCGYSLEAYSPVQEQADKYNVRFLEYTRSDICNYPDYFEDSYHLNDKGAKIYTNNLVKRLNG